MCIFIGFDSKSAVHRSAVASFLLVALFSGLKVAASYADENATLAAGPGDHHHQLLVPFRSAVSVVGILILFLSVLIASSRFHTGFEHGGAATSKWYFCNFIMLVLLVASVFGGHVYGMVGMANVGTTFAVIWCLDKYAELHIQEEWNGWFLVLLLSFSLWRVSLFLHQHPNHVTSMFSAM